MKKPILIFVFMLSAILCLVACGGENDIVNPTVTPLPSAAAESEDVVEEEEVIPPEVLYQNAVGEYGEGDFDAAALSLETVPDDYMDAALYKSAIAAYESYKAEEWLNCITALDLLYDEVLAEVRAKINFKTNNGRKLPQEEFDRLTGREETFYVPLANVLYKEHSKKNKEPMFRYNWTGSVPVRFCEDLFGECLYYYYDGMIQQGADLNGLKDFPLDQEAAETDPTTWNNRTNMWRRFRSRKVTDAISPDSVALLFESGNPNTAAYGLYIMSKDVTVHELTISNLSFDMSPFDYADKPEDIRYIVKFTEYVGFYGTYDDGTSGYTTYISVTLKDIVDGKTLFEELYSVDPPKKAPRNGLDSYGKFTGDEAFTDDLKQVLYEIFPPFENSDNPDKSPTP